jgi:thioredoxin reductase (NADPH)
MPIPENLFDASDENIPFFVVLNGSVLIARLLNDGESVVAARTAGQFTGEMTMISGRRSIFRGHFDEPELFVDGSFPLRKCRPVDSRIVIC